MLDGELCVRAFSQLTKSLGIACIWIDRQNHPIWIDDRARTILGMIAGDDTLPAAMVAALGRSPNPGDGALRTLGFALPSEGVEPMVSWCTESAEDGSRLVLLEREPGSVRSLENSSSDERAAEVHRIAKQFEHDVRTPLNAMSLHLALLETLVDASGTKGPAITPAQAMKSFEAVRSGIRRIDEMARNLAAASSSPKNA